MTKSKMFRMKYETYRKLKHLYPAQRGETCASYFERLAKHLEDEQEMRTW